ncbi:MAG TPA: PAS domain-containing protein [Rhizomicrobium sp.]|nr:PAS domain-containing protein [Rhizomicrobium sp.]
MKNGNISLEGYGNLDLRDVYEQISTPRHRDSQKLIAFWNARPSDGIVMSRDVPSRQIADLLSRISVWEPVIDTTDLRVRLAGEAVNRRLPGDIRGRLMSELFRSADFKDHMYRTRRVIESGQPLILDSRLFAGRIERLHMEVVLLPIRSPDRSHIWLMVGVFYFDSAPGPRNDS